MICMVNPHNVIMCSIFCLVFFLFSFNVQISQATQSRTHDLGDFKFSHHSSESLITNNSDPTGEWPQDVYLSANVIFINHLQFVGSWMDESGELQSKTAHDGASFQDQQPPYVITEYRRYAPPDVTVFVNGSVQQSSPQYTGKIDPNLPCDIMIENRYKAVPGFHVVCRSYSFSNSNHDDYVIFERTYTFTGDHDEDPDLEVDTDYGLHGVYFILGYCMQTAAGTWISYSRWYEEGKDEWTNYEMVPSQLVSGARDLVVSYSWDGDYLDESEFEPGGQLFDDTGDPRWAFGSGGSNEMPSGEFVSATYNGFAVLHADLSTSDKSDDISQPYSIISNVWVYDLWDQSFGSQYPSLWDWANSGDRQDVTTTPGWPTDPTALEGDYPFQAIGPYDFALGDSIKIVHVIASNGIDRSLSIEKGLEWRSWYRGEVGATFDDAAKNALLASGKDSLFQSLDRALWAWSRGLDVPDPLPAPDLTVISGINRIDLEWEDMSDVGDPDTGVPDLDHYNIYRKRGNFLVDMDNELKADGSHLVWQLIATVPKTETTYSDEDLIDGVSYHYAVTAVDDGTQNWFGLLPGQKLESSRYKNRSQIAAIPFVTPDSVGEGSNVTLMSALWQEKECTALIVHENIGYFGFGSNLQIYNLSDPSNLVDIGEIILPGGVRDVAFSGTYAYVASSDSGLRIIDISNPSNPVEAGFFNNDQVAADAIAVSGNYAYLTSGNLRIIDISNPSNPVEIGSFYLGSTSDLRDEVVVSGDFAYVIDFNHAINSHGLRIIDISNPANPTDVGLFDSEYGHFDFAVSSNYLYGSHRYSGLRIFDISNPENPMEVGSFEMDDYSIDVAIEGSYAYVSYLNLADKISGIRVIDISNPANPVEVGYFNTNFSVDHIAANGKYIYLTLQPAAYKTGIIVLQNDLLTDIPKNQIEIPREYNLSQNFPNPFNPTTTIKYSLPKASLVQLKIYDTRGRLVTTLVDDYKQAGEHAVTWDATWFSSGVYYYHIQAGNFTAVKKGLLIK